MELSAKFLTASDDLENVVANINSAQWDAKNEMVDYEAESLRHYLQQVDTLFMVCYYTDSTGSFLAGIASGRVQHKPYEKVRWLYIDEVDTAANLRQRGVASAMMKLLLEYATRNNLAEVWLGTEADNAPARRLYASLKPDFIDQVVGYTFELE
jgi:ribosomal protein S18 acetylase RimI-like enzyme